MTANEEKMMLWGGAGVIVFLLYQSYQSQQTAQLAAAQAAQAAANAVPTLNFNDNYLPAITPIPTDVSLTLPAQQCNAQNGTWTNGACTLPSLSSLRSNKPRVRNVVRMRGYWG